MRQLRKQARLTRTLRGIGIAAFLGYLGWNAYWLAHWRLPPSIWTRATGLPCPTSGMTRGMRALLAGNLVEFVLYNALAVPILLLLAYSGFFLLRALFRKQRLALPPRVAALWLIVLVAAWFSKFIIGPQYW